MRLNNYINEFNSSIKIITYKTVGAVFFSAVKFRANWNAFDSTHWSSGQMGAPKAQLFVHHKKLVSLTKCASDTNNLGKMFICAL